MCLRGVRGGHVKASVSSLSMDLLRLRLGHHGRPALQRRCSGHSDQPAIEILISENMVATCPCQCLCSSSSTVPARRTPSALHFCGFSARMFSTRLGGFHTGECFRREWVGFTRVNVFVENGWVSIIIIIIIYLFLPC